MVQNWRYGSGLIQGPGTARVVTDGRITALTMKVVGVVGFGTVQIGNGQTVIVPGNDTFGLGGTEFCGIDCTNVIVEFGIPEGAELALVYFVAWCSCRTCKGCGE